MWLYDTQERIYLPGAEELRTVESDKCQCETTSVYFSVSVSDSDTRQSAPCTYTHTHIVQHIHSHTGTQRLYAGTAVLLWHTAYSAHHIRYTAAPYPETRGPQWHTDTVACFTKCWHTLLGILYCQVTFTRYTLTHICMHSFVLQYSERTCSKMGAYNIQWD